MKTNSLPIQAFLAAIAATAFLPVGPVAASIAFTATGLLAILLSDYGRDSDRLRVPSNVVPFDRADRSLDRLDEAA
jgi:hypothetical protein